MIKNYSQSPLPFQGQKRRFLPEFKIALKQFSNAPMFVDLFGGSGLLAHTVKQMYPDSDVIYNDFDDYHLRIANIERTNALLAKFRIILQNEPVDKVISKEAKQSVLKAIEREEKRTGYIDYITISSSLLFSMNYAMSFEDMKKQWMYNCVRKSDYESANDYLHGVQVVKMDYRELFERWKHITGVVFLVDPPYLSTDVSTYSNYWKLANYLDVLSVLKGTSYFYFTSNKSSIIELTDWIELNLGAENPFKGATKKEMAARMNHNAGYTDIMLWRRV
jgi:site-specific DNA-adenine methylase